MHTIRLPQEQLSEFTQLFSGAQRINAKSEYEYGRYKIDGLTMIIYTSGKVVFSDIPPGSIRERIIGFLVERDPFPGPVIGSDEAGKGESIGPMIVSAVLLRTPEDRALARFNGAMDSKELSAVQLSEVSKRMKEYPHAVRIMPPSDFNVRFNAGNLNELLIDMHLSAIESLLKKVDNSEKCTIIIDKFCGRKHEHELESKLHSINENSDITITTKGERFEAVAAASILAKSEYEKWLDDYSHSHKIDVRSLTLSQIRSHKNKEEFCKLAYLAGRKGDD